MTSTISFKVEGVVRGKDRPRATKTGRMYTTQQTRSAEARVQSAWAEAGRPSFGESAVTVTVSVIVERPAGHYRVNGELSASGCRAPVPMRKPDVDNVLKLVADSLNALAWRDDKQIVDARVVRRWAPAGVREHLFVSISPHTAMTALEAA